MLKIPQARLQQYVDHELPDVQAGFRKGRGTRIKLPTYAGSSKKQENSRKTSISALLIMPKPLNVWIIINWKILQENYRYQGNISCKDGLNKGQKWYGLNRSR